MENIFFILSDCILYDMETSNSTKKPSILKMAFKELFGYFESILP